MWGTSKTLLALEQRMKKQGYSDQEILDVFNEGLRQAQTEPLVLVSEAISFVQEAAAKVRQKSLRAFYGEVT